MIHCSHAALFLAAMLLSACGTTANLAPGAAIKITPDSAILLMGVKPAYRVHLLRGDTTANTWVRPTLDVPEINLAPNEYGYIVVAVPPTSSGKRLGVATIFPEGKVYGPCEGSLGPTMELTPGMINYVGNLNYDYAGGKLKYSIDFDEDEARRYVEKNFPDSLQNFKANRLVQMTVRTNFCDKKSITIPIYIPKR